MNFSPQSPKKLKETLFERIENEQVCPRSRWLFKSRECFVWLLWLVSVAVGALAVSISLFVATHRQYAFYEATHNNIFTFLVDVLPFLWLFIFGLMVYVAIYNLRHTARGYRYPVWLILSSSLLLSFAGGSAMQFFGLGYSVDDILGKNMAIYMSQEKLERKMWQAPNEGRLVGRQVFSTMSPTTTIIFEDISGQRWNMNVSDLYQHEIELLSGGHRVRLIGERTVPDFLAFYACGAFPWMMEKGVTAKDMSQEREMFVDRLSEHFKIKPTSQSLGSEESLSSEKSIKPNPCANLPVIKKMLSN